MTYSFRPYHGPGVDSVPSENEYQEHFLGVKAAGAWGWRPHHLHVPNVMEIWEPKPPGALWATPGLLRESFTFTFLMSVSISTDMAWRLCGYERVLTSESPFCVTSLLQLLLQLNNSLPINQTTLYESRIPYHVVEAFSRPRHNLKTFVQIPVFFVRSDSCRFFSPKT